MLGKHFRVESSFKPTFSRHYTVCNVMQPKLYQGLIEALKTNGNLPDAFYDNKEAVDHISITVKNYKRTQGLSATFFQKQIPIEYRVTGPMGKGLCPTWEGVHLAFAAGTGVLTFMDFAAHVAMLVLQRN